MDELLIINDLVKHYPVRKGIVPRTAGYVRAVDGVSLSIARGETLGLVGESGCGKTTLGRAVLRLTEPTSGQIVFEGRNLLALSKTELRRLRREMQIVFQDPYGSLNPRMTVAAILEEPIVVHASGGWAARRRLARERVAELLRLVGLEPEHAARYPHEFSGGQRQRIAIARALTLQPKFVVCDEPVSALDVSMRAQILNLLREIQQRFNLTYLFVAHDLSVVRHVSDRVAVMYLGKVVELASAEEVFSNPMHPYTRVMLASIPISAPLAGRERIKIKGEVPSPIDPPSGCRFHPRCPIAVDECREDEPALREVTTGHRVACIRAEIAPALVSLSRRG